MPDWLRIFPDSNHRWTMGVRPGDVANYFASRDETGTLLPERARLLADEPEKYALLLPEGEPSLRETVALAQSLGITIPELHSREPRTALTALGSAWEPDLVWLLPAAGGAHRVVGGVVCFPSSWALADKLGLPMAEVHAPVPGLNEVLGRQVDRFLEKLAPGDSWTRENWSLSRTPARNQHTSLQHATSNWPRLDAETPADEVWIRLEHQILLRLPQSGAVLFGIRIESVPLGDLLLDATASARFARTLETMSDEAAAYKNFLAMRARLIGFLRDAAAR
ncbi:MAG: DUF3445 domain-containing protein [Planctomycetia bacterium]|nr:DUF3445 domain-containing protein [Planctomycetia bacterium]